ncbi:MAG TPA: homocysteine S-methyltransferase family protein [Myxococcota bacterium]|nr:homocysteine S-methyltransferase family protein [Myxococcota bacterium]
MGVDLAAVLAAPPVLLDGGMGSALIARGLRQGRPPELWNIERPEQVEEVHAAYIAAGSDVVQTNTFGGNEIALANCGLAERMEELNRAAVQIARAAAGDRIVAGNIGPSGELLPPVGTADPALLKAAFARQAAALESAGADMLAIETMTDLREALCALEGALEATGLPVTVCLSFDRKRRGFFTMMGDRLEEAAAVLADAGATAVGANCSVGSEVLLEATALLVAASSVPVIIKPNAGLPEVTPEGLVYRQEPGAFARDMAAAARLGAAAIGGCCGTDERFIAALARALR